MQIRDEPNEDINNPDRVLDTVTFTSGLRSGHVLAARPASALPLADKCEPHAPIPHHQKKIYIPFYTSGIPRH